MPAIRLTSSKSIPELCELPIPTPGPTAVLLRVEAVGLCHSDLHLLDAKSGSFPFSVPFTLGHEIAGTVVEVGSNVSEDWLEKTVAVHSLTTCGECAACVGGRDNYCENLGADIALGIGQDGGLAEYVLVPSVRQLVPIGDLPPEMAAPLTDAGITSFHAIRQHKDVLTEGSKVLVVGVGGLGHLAVQILSQTTSARIFAVDTRAASREDAERLGAERVFASMSEIATESSELKFDVVFDFVGSGETTDGGLNSLAQGGRLVLVGSAGAELKLGKQLGLPRGWSVSAPFWGTKQDLIDVIALAVEGRLSVHTEIYRLEEGESAYEELRRGAIRGRGVIMPHLVSQHQ